MAASTKAAAPKPPSLDSVLDYAWTVHDFTATAAMASTGLTRSTTIDALDTLTAYGLLRELPNARETSAYRKGRPARRFELREDAAVLLGVDAGRASVTVAVTDLRSRVLVRHRLTLDVDCDHARTRRRSLITAVRDALASAGRAQEDVLAVCVGVPAPVDAQGRSPQHHDGFWGRMNPDLVDAFAWAPLVRVENDASLAAIAEGTLGEAVGCRDYVSLLAGSRLGAGVVVDGRVLRGAHGGVGEMVAFCHVVGVGSADGLGTRAARLAREQLSRGEIAADSALGRMSAEQLDGRVVLELAAQGDDDALGITERLGAVLARIVSVLGSMFDPQLVVVSGAVSAGVEEVIAAARRALSSDHHLPVPELVGSRLGADIVVMGAVAAASSTAREQVLSVWRQGRPTSDDR